MSTPRFTLADSHLGRQLLDHSYGCKFELIRSGDGSYSVFYQLRGNLRMRHADGSPHPEANTFVELLSAFLAGDETATGGEDGRDDEDGTSVF